VADDVVSSATPDRQSPVRVSLRRLPGLVARAFGFVRESGRREFALVLALEVVSAVGIAAQLLLARALFGSLLETGSQRFTLGSVAPELIGLAITTIVAGFSATALSERRMVLTELVGRHIHDRLIEAATRADLEAFDTPDFYDRLERARENAAQRTYELASGVIALGAGMFGLAALVGVLFTLGLPLLPLVLLAYVPLWWATSRNGGRATSSPSGRRLPTGSVNTSNRCLRASPRPRRFDSSDCLPPFAAATTGSTTSAYASSAGWWQSAFGDHCWRTSSRRRSSSGRPRC